MKNIFIFFLASILIFTQCGCATLFGEKYLTSDQLAAQHHKPENGEPKRKIRPVALVFDILTIYAAPLAVGIDFATGDIYKPCKVNVKYNCTVQKDTLQAQELDGMTYSDKNLDITFDITSTSINFKINNNANQSMKIDWNDVTIVQGGSTDRAIHTGVKLTNKNESQPPSTIPSHSMMDDGVVPSDNINLSAPSTYNAGGWNYRPLAINNRLRLFLPIQFQGKTIEYNITFTKTVTVKSHS